MQTTKLTPYTVGVDALEALGEICAPLGSRLLAIGGRTALAKIWPHLERAARKGGLSLLDPLWYGGQCTYENMDALAEQAGGYRPLPGTRDMVVLGVGGGKAIDTAKGVAHRLGLPLVTVPTIAATCAAVTRLSVVYRPDGSFREFAFCPEPPLHCIIPTGIIAQAPEKYLRAGMGDALAKHYECTMASRGDHLNYPSALGVAVSATCAQLPLDLGTQALLDCAQGQAAPALEQAVLGNIVSTGMVSSLVDEDYNGAVAHSLFYGLTLVPGLEERCLHGDVVAYGVLVQTALDRGGEELASLGPRLAALGFPTTLASLGVDITRPAHREALEAAVEEALRGPDMKRLPRPVTREELWKAILQVEEAGFPDSGYLYE